MKIGDQLTVKIVDIARGGAGIAKTDKGRTIFVPYAMTGDVVNIEIEEIKQNYINAKLLEIIKASTQRQTPQCEVFGLCGGCQWQHVPYNMQWKIKINGVKQALRSCGIKTNIDIQTFPADSIWNYRNRIQLRGAHDKIGFFASQSHDLVPIDQCAIAKPEINSHLDQVRSQGSALSSTYKVELELAENGEIKEYWNSHHAAGGFRQVNDEQNKKLQQWIATTLSSQQPVYDLYGGFGNLSHLIAQNNIEIHCVDRTSLDINPDNIPESLHIHNDDVLPWLKNRITDLMYKRIPAPATPWSAIIDPPRGGMGNEFDDIINRLEKLNVNEIILVGCKTDTWARDIAKFLQRQWHIKNIGVFDFFPQTTHVECAVHLNYID